MLINSLAKSQEYVINLEIPQTDKPAKAYIAFGKEQDTISLLNGKGIFKGVKEPQRAFIYVDLLGDNDFGHGNPVFVTPGSTNIIIEDINDQDKNKITGNLYAVAYEYELGRPVREWNKQNKKYLDLYTEAIQKGSADSTQYQRLQYEAIYNCFQVPQRYIKTNPGSPVCITALMMMGKGNPVAKVDIDTLKTLFASLATEVKESAEGKKYFAKVNTY